MTELCYKIAQELAKHDINNLKCEEGGIVCDVCDGVGLVTNKGPIITTFGKKYSEEEFNKEHTTTCFMCFGKGKVSYRIAWRNIMIKYVWCKCDKKTTTVCYEHDEIFGKTTWLCSECGMVVQFG